MEVSKFGAEVIKEMNRNGIMVDLSHGGEKSFYDALDISTQPNCLAVTLIVRCYAMYLVTLQTIRCALWQRKVV